MMRQLISYTFLLMLFAGCQATEPVSQQQRPHEHLVFPELKPFDIPEPAQFTHNGITFFLLKDDELPLIDVRVIVNGGSWLDPADKVGRAALTGSVMRNGGSELYPEEELNELLENRAASMETSFGLATGSARMNVLKDDFDELLPVFLDLMKNPVFPQERIDLAKTQQRTAISRRNEEASQVASREFRKLIYGPESIYARTTEYTTLNNITREDLKAFHGKVYQGSNMLVGVIGDFDPNVMRSRLKEVFSELEEGEAIETDLPEVDYEFGHEIHFAHKGDMNQSQIRMGHIGGYRDNPDYAALQVMNQILSGGFSGRLMQEVRTDQGLAYSVYGNYSSNVRYPGVFFSGLSTAAETTKEALEATMYQIQRLQNEKVTKQELEETKERIFNRIIFRYDSYSRILSEWMNNYNLGLPEDTFEQYIEDVRKVTVDDIYRVANEYLRPGEMKILIVGNRDLIEEQLAELGPYNEVDISIPRPASERAAMEGDPDAGRQWMKHMSDAILVERQSVDSVEFRGTQHVQTPQGEMALNIKSLTTYPDQLTLDMSTPMGSQRLELADGHGVMKMGGQEQALPESMVTTLLNALKREPLYLALKYDELNAFQLATDDANYATVYIDGELELTLKIEKESQLPVEITYMDFDQNSGSEVQITIRYDEWTAGDGIMMPYQQSQYSDDEPVSRTRLEEHRVH